MHSQRPGSGRACVAGSALPVYTQPSRAHLNVLRGSKCQMSRAAVRAAYVAPWLRMLHLSCGAWYARVEAAVGLSRGQA
jgi:hypothetical protein